MATSDNSTSNLTSGEKKEAPPLRETFATLATGGNGRAHMTEAGREALRFHRDPDVTGRTSPGVGGEESEVAQLRSALADAQAEVEALQSEADGLRIDLRRTRQNLAVAVKDAANIALMDGSEIADDYLQAGFFAPTHTVREILSAITALDAVGYKESMRVRVARYQDATPEGIVILVPVSLAAEVR